MSSPYHVIMWFRSSFSSDFDSSISILDVPVSSAIFVSANQEEQAHMLRFITVPTMRSAVLIFERCFFCHSSLSVFPPSPTFYISED